MSRYDRLALLLTAICLILSSWVSLQIFEGIPHLEDEIAYVWQAKTITHNDLSIESPPCPTCFLVPFVVDYQGIRFSKYPPGWPAVLSLGLRLDIRPYVNPILAAFSAWLIYLLIKKITDEKTALLAVFLLIISPFFLLNAGSLLSHIWSLWLFFVFLHAWFDTFYFFPKQIPGWLTALLAGLALGLLVLTRPLTAVGLALPFILHGLFLLFTASPALKKLALLSAGSAALLAGFILIWQLALTGELSVSTYQLWWPYDKVGFGSDIGLQPGGYQWKYAKANAKFSLRAGYADLFGWFRYSWIFIPFGLIALRKNIKAWLISLTIPALVGVYLFYWIGSWLFGPRYYFEAILAAVLLTAAGFVWLFRLLSAPAFQTKKWMWVRRLGFFLLFLVSTSLVVFNLVYYLPQRLGNMKGLYGATRSQLDPFLTESAMDLTPAIIVVHIPNHWIEYATLLELSSPYQDTPFIFTFTRGPIIDYDMAKNFPERSMWYYYPEEPYKFYSNPRQ
ncbi:MAG: hypothetical protein CL609_15870 [Anaerolineaceae bacterium]|nr:hypothetical protein [Anaerolineaceae bacterium]